jgi:Transposase, Mutator family
MRRTPTVDALIPALYLKGISTGDFTEALEAILGEGASGLSATNIVRLKASWEADYKAWSQRDLSENRYVYWWADGVYCNVRLDEERTCVLKPDSKTNSAESPKGQNRYSHLMWAEADLIGPLSANVSPFSMNVGLSGPYSQAMWSRDRGCFRAKTVYVFGSLQLRGSKPATFRNRKQLHGTARMHSKWTWVRLRE